MGPGLQSRPDQQPVASATPAPVHTPPPAAVSQAAPAAATPGAAVAAAGLGAAPADHGPRLNSFWNWVMGGPDKVAGDGRPLSENHIGSRSPSPVPEDGPVSNAMRNTPYLGDYWEALSVTHDSTHQKGLMNELTAVTDVALPGPLMALADAPFRAFGHSLFLDQK